MKVRKTLTVNGTTKIPDATEHNTPQQKTPEVDNDNSFEVVYRKWKEGMKILRSQLSSEVSDNQLVKVITTAEDLLHCVEGAFKNLPLPTNRLRLRQMDSCTANTKNLTGRPPTL